MALLLGTLLTPPMPLLLPTSPTWDPPTTPLAALPPTPPPPELPAPPPPPTAKPPIPLPTAPRPLPPTTPTLEPLLPLADPLTTIEFIGFSVPSKWFSVDAPPEPPVPATLPTAFVVPSEFWVPGNAGKSSLDIVNSDCSDVGCFTMPTEIRRGARWSPRANE
uniref:MIP17283p n=1 Tax=Drosophila melanogaster TaxID=7227 RepID=D3DMV0_DROME|nr:MIP17283p [Drosophila melanogaster]